MSYDWDFSALWSHRWLLAQGTGYTLLFTFATIAIGMAIGIAVALLRLVPSKVVSTPLIVYIGVFRCTPVLVQMIWMYYALPVLTGILLGPATAAIVTLSLYGGAFFAEIMRAGIESIDRGQWDGARALGMRRHAVLKRIIMPQALTRMVPPLCSQCILQLKNTSLVSVIAVPDLLYQSQVITAATFRPLEVYTVSAVIYFLLLFPASLGVEYLETRLAKGR